MIIVLLRDLSPFRGLRFEENYHCRNNKWEKLGSLSGKVESLPNTRVPLAYLASTRHGESSDQRGAKPGN